MTSGDEKEDENSSPNISGVSTATTISTTTPVEILDPEEIARLYSCDEAEAVDEEDSEGNVRNADEDNINVKEVRDAKFMENEGTNNGRHIDAVLTVNEDFVTANECNDSNEAEMKGDERLETVFEGEMLEDAGFKGDDFCCFETLVPGQVSSDTPATVGYAGQQQPAIEYEKMKTRLEEAEKQIQILEKEKVDMKLKLQELEASNTRHIAETNAVFLQLQKYTDVSGQKSVELTCKDIEIEALKDEILKQEVERDDMADCLRILTEKCNVLQSKKMVDIENVGIEQPNIERKEQKELAKKTPTSVRKGKKTTEGPKERTRSLVKNVRARRRRPKVVSDFEYDHPGYEVRGKKRKITGEEKVIDVEAFIAKTKVSKKGTKVTLEATKYLTDDDKKIMVDIGKKASDE